MPAAHENDLRCGTETNPFFAVVIGTGFGGAVTACRLAQACAVVKKDGEPERRICVLERGRRYERTDFPRGRLPDYLSATPTSKRIPDTARMTWSNDQGLWDLRNLGELRLAQAAGYGGGSLIYANVHLRAPESAFTGWHAMCADAEPCACRDSNLRPPAYTRPALDPYYDRAATMLEVTPLPVAQQAKYPKTVAMQNIATTMGAPAAPQFVYPPLAISFDAHPGDKNRFGREQHPCTGCGNCTIGCQEGAKNTLDLNYLAMAEDLEAEVRTLAEVETIREVKADGKTKVCITYHDHVRNERTVVWAKHAFVCAGALSSTEILMRSARDAPSPPGVKAMGSPLHAPPTLGHKFYANGDSLGVVFETKEAIKPQNGPTITATIVHGGPAWFLLQDGGIPPSLKEGLGLFKSPLWGARNRFLPAPRAESRILARILELAKSARPYWLDPKLTAPVARAAASMVPTALDGLAADLGAVDDSLSRDVEDSLKAILEKVDESLRHHWLGALYVFAQRTLAGYKGVVLPATISALIDRYPALKDLIGADKRTAAFVLAAARFALLGEPVSDHEMMFLSMGPDQSGSLVTRDGHLRIVWDGDHSNRPLYGVQERLMRDAAAALGGELRTNPDWTLGQHPVTVHAQGGCSMSNGHTTGVTTPCGRHWGSEAVFVLDGGSFPNSVGVNPSATIAAVAERNVELFIRRVLPGAAVDGAFLKVPPPKGPKPPPPAPVLPRADLPAAPPLPIPGVPASQPLGISFTEVMRGFVSLHEGAALAKTLFMGSHADARRAVDHRDLVNLGRWGRENGISTMLSLTATIEDLDAMIRQVRPEMGVKGSLTLAAPGKPPVGYAVEGKLYLELKKTSLEPGSRDWIDKRVLTGMTYELGGDISLKGRKFVRDDPGFDAWSDLSTLYTNVDNHGAHFMGVIQQTPTDFISGQLRGMNALGGTPQTPIDDVQKGWTLIRFARFFFGSAKNAYTDWF